MDPFGPVRIEVANARHATLVDTPMRPFHAVAAILLLFAPLACQKPHPGPPEGSQQPRQPRKVAAAPKAPQRPKPLTLPARPTELVHLAQPAAFINTLAAYAQDGRNAKAIVQAAATQSGHAFEAKLAPHVAFNRSWDAARVEGQLIVHLPIEPASVETVTTWFRTLPRKGEFGAVEIPRPAGEVGPTVASFDPKTRRVTLAGDLRGIETGPLLEKTYGRTAVNGRLTQELAGQYGVEMLAQTIEVTGSDATNFDLSATGVPTDIPELGKMANGALTGMLESPRIAMGASSLYTGYANDVKHLNAEIAGEIEQQNFLVRGVLDEMHKDLRPVLKGWNGRVMVGVGPARHAMLGVGSNDPAALGNSTLHFLGGLLGNLKVAKQFGVGGLPNLRFARDHSKVGDTSIHVLSITAAKQYVPREAWALVDDKGVLHVSVAFRPRAGGAMVVAGPQAPQVLRQWLEDTVKAMPGSESNGHFAAATVAIGPQDVSRILAEPTQALTLSANRKPIRFVVQKTADRVKVEARTAPT